MRFSNFAIGIVLIHSQSNIGRVDAFSAPNLHSRIFSLKTVTNRGTVLKSGNDFPEDDSSSYHGFTGDEISKEVLDDTEVTAGKQPRKGDGILAGMLGVAPALYASKVRY